MDGIMDPRLEYGIGRPRSMDIVGTKSIWCILLNISTSFFCCIIV